MNDFFSFFLNFCQNPLSRPSHAQDSKQVNDNLDNLNKDFQLFYSLLKLPEMLKSFKTNYILLLTAKK